MKMQKLMGALILILMLGATPVTAQNMSDSQVLEYVKEGIRQGKEQKQLASELARRGVTKEQALRVKQLYEQQNNVNASNATGTDINESRLREEMKEGCVVPVLRRRKKILSVRSLTCKSLMRKMY